MSVVDFKLSRIGDYYDITFTDGEPDMVEGAEAVAQHGTQRLLTFRGESVYNLRAGVPWLVIVGAGRDSGAIFFAEQELRDTPGITAIHSFEPTFDNTTGELSIAATIAISDEEIDLSIALPELSP